MLIIKYLTSEKGETNLKIKKKSYWGKVVKYNLIVAAAMVVSCLFSGCTTVSHETGHSEEPTLLKYPGSLEANQVLETWEQAIRSKDEDLFKLLMPDPLIIYENELGEEITFKGIKSVLAFRLDYFTVLGPPEDYNLPDQLEAFSDE